MYKEYPPPSEFVSKFFKDFVEKNLHCSNSKNTTMKILNVAAYKTSDLNSDLPKLKHDIV